MLEREIKLHVPAPNRPTIERALRQAGATDVLLRAQYFDTQDSDLAKAGIALRLRLEGEHWVQTVKAPGPDALTRVELNHQRTEAEPALNLSLYRSTSLEPYFQRLNKPLLLRYETSVTRWVLRQDSCAGQIEFAFDQGSVRSGDLQLALCELELEQLGGHAKELFALAQQWTRRYGLVLDLRSKAERGSILANVAVVADRQQAEPDLLPLLRPQHASVLAPDPGLSATAAYQRYAGDCLNQIIRNAALLSGVEPTYTSPKLYREYIYQLRLGMRRLRTCRHLFKNQITSGDTTPEAELRRYTDMFGRTDPSQAQALAASADFQLLLLGLLADQIDDTTAHNG